MESSAIVSMHLSEHGRHEAVLAEVAAADMVFASPIAEVEVRSRLARARYTDNPRRLRTDAEYDRVRTAFIEDWRRRRYFRIRLARPLLESASFLVEKHRLRGYDGIHLASLVTLTPMLPEVAISTWDRELAAAAVAEGFSLAHEVTN